jgi:hypothetical protein
VTDAERLRAVETLLAEPEELGDDVLESCLYLLRDRLAGPGRAGADTPAVESRD